MTKYRIIEQGSISLSERYFSEDVYETIEQANEACDQLNRQSHDYFYYPCEVNDFNNTDQ